MCRKQRGQTKERRLPFVAAPSGGPPDVKSPPAERRDESNLSKQREGADNAGGGLGGRGGAETTWPLMEFHRPKPDITFAITRGRHLRLVFHTFVYEAKRVGDPIRPARPQTPSAHRNFSALVAAAAKCEHRATEESWRAPAPRAVGAAEMRNARKTKETLNLLFDKVVLENPYSVMSQRARTWFPGR